MDVADNEVHAWDPLIRVPQGDVDDLRDRLRRTRWPRRWPRRDPWSAGTDFGELQRLTEYWGSHYDWRLREREINEHPSYWTTIDGQRIHFLRFDAETKDSPAVILTNGWPSTFFELVGLARRLSAPSRLGDTGMALTVIVPSLPGFTFSDPAGNLTADCCDSRAVASPDDAFGLRDLLRSRRGPRQRNHLATRRGPP